MITQNDITLNINRGYSISGLVRSQNDDGNTKWLPHAKTPAHPRQPVSV